MHNAPVSTSPPPPSFELSRSLEPSDQSPAARPMVGAAAALAVTIPHALGLGLVAYAPFVQLTDISSLALWSCALPGAVMTLMARARGVVYAPSTAVALLFGGMLALVMRAGAGVGITAAQALAITGMFVALGFVLQWLMGQMGLANLSRFLPVSVSQGFSAGVGLSLILSQLHNALGAGQWQWGPVLWWHLGLAAVVAALTVWLQKPWPRFPAMLPVLLLCTVAVWVLAPQAPLRVAGTSHAMVLPLVPDWLNAPWWPVLQQVGMPLLSLSVLMAVVNALEVLVFHQHLETEHQLRGSPDTILKRESFWSAWCALSGMIPASTSTSRSHTALSYTGTPTLRVGQWHALVLLMVALTGHLWLQWLPLACLAGTLLVAGARMVPAIMWQRPTAPMQRLALWQSWLVASLFALSGGAMALLAGLAVSTLSLLRHSGNHAIRRIHTDGKMRSRHVRRAGVENWLAQRMHKVAVFELQGIVSFGVAALVVEQVHKHLSGHLCVILDAARVPSWDDTGHSRIRSLAIDLHRQGIVLVLSGAKGWPQAHLDELHHFADLDYALEWAEEQILMGCPPSLMVSDPPFSLLGDLGVGMPENARLALEAHLTRQHFEAEATILRTGDRGRSMLLVQQGTVSMSTAPAAGKGMRLSVIGPGMVFGEMAFLNGIARTAYAYAGPGGADVCELEWTAFQAWSQQYPQAALSLMHEFARMGIRRLGATSLELRAALA